MAAWPPEPMTDSHGGPDAIGVALHDFSVNSNACGPCPVALAAVQAADAGRYPDPQSTDLRGQLAAFHQIDAARIVIAASGSEFIQRITAAVAQGGGRRVGLPAHSYGDYARAAQAWQLATVREPEAAAAVDLRWCCDPSSPLGQTPPALSAQIDAWDGQGVRVLDMAYAPLRLEGAPALGPAQRDRVWQLWTPNKALGLTGVRAAYAIAPAAGVDPALRDRIDALAPSWPLGAHGAALLDAWTADGTRQWLSGSLQTLRTWKAAQRELVNDRLGWSCLAGDANFFCVKCDVAYADLAPVLRGYGIKVRDGASFGLPGHLRLAVLPPASQQALVPAVEAARAFGSADSAE